MIDLNVPAQAQEINAETALHKQVQIHLDEILENIARIHFLARSLTAMDPDQDDMGTLSLMFKQIGDHLSTHHECIEKLVFDARDK